MKTHIPEPHLQRSGVAESGVESESYHPSQHPGSADTPSSGAHTVRISVLNVHYPHMTVWYSPVSQKPLSCPQVPFFNIIWKGRVAWHATGVAILEFQGFLTWRLQTPKGFTERSTPLVIQCIFFFFALKIFFWVGCHEVCQLPEESVTQKLLKTSSALPSEWHLVVSL